MAQVTNLKEEDGTLTFNVTGLNVSYINAIRRIILSDIPIIVFKTTPYSENKCNIQINTSRLNNEIVKQRLSCIPICINDIEFNYKNYILELDVENKTDTIMYVTTKDFKIKNITNNTYLDENELKKIFPPFIPPNGKGEYYIDFLRLRPKLSEELLGERIKLTCELSIGTAREDSMFNLAGTCSYGFTVDEEKMNEQLEIRKQKWKDEGKTEKDITFEAANWKLLEGKRYVKTNSFDFILNSVGIYENNEIIVKACTILTKKLIDLDKLLKNDEVEIKPSDTTLENSYDIILENEDYTVGNILKTEIYNSLYRDMTILNYIGFKKFHPHDSHSILRLSFVEPNKDVSSVKQILTVIINEAVTKIVKLMELFKK